MGSVIVPGTKVAIVMPDYFANRRIVEFLHGEVVPIYMDYLNVEGRTGIDMSELEKVLKKDVDVFVFSNPNNPTGVVYTPEEIKEIAELASRYGVFVIVDELYSRQIFDGRSFTHLCAEDVIDSEQVITIMGPSQTESLSGFRLGVAFGSAKVIQRMEDLQAIVSIRAGGYNQAVLKTWFNEPEGWLTNRIAQHQNIRDGLVNQFPAAEGFKVSRTEGGSYLFPQIPKLAISIDEFVERIRVQAVIVVTPGRLIDEQATESARINFSQDKQIAMDAVERMTKFANKYRM